MPGPDFDDDDGAFRARRAMALYRASRAQDRERWPVGCTVRHDLSIRLGTVRETRYYDERNVDVLVSGLGDDPVWIHESRLRHVFTSEQLRKVCTCLTCRGTADVRGR